MLALRRSRTRGFTLLELLITIAVVAILASIAAPSFQNMIATQRVRSAASDLVSALNFARSEAVKRNAIVTVTPVGGDWSDGWTIASGGTTLQNHEEFDGITLTGTPTATALSFGGDGRRNSVDVEVQIDPPAGSGASKHCIGVSPTGKPSSNSGAC